MSERWLTTNEAVTLIKARIGGSVGRAQGELAKARASGEVRDENPDMPIRLWADDGVVNLRLPRQIGETQISEDDLNDWLDRNHGEPAPGPVASARFPGDAALVEEGRRMLADGMQKRAIARKLAERAEGAGTLESKVDRLRRLLGAGNPKSSQ